MDNDAAGCASAIVYVRFSGEAAHLKQACSQKRRALDCWHCLKRELPGSLRHRLELHRPYKVHEQLSLPCCINMVDRAGAWMMMHSTCTPWCMQAAHVLGCPEGNHSMVPAAMALRKHWDVLCRQVGCIETYSGSATDVYKRDVSGMPILQTTSTL